MGWRRQRKAEGGSWPAYMRDRAARAASPRLARYYAAGVPAPEKAIGEIPLVALDMETTGLEEARHAIVSIGVVPFTLRRIPVAGRRYWVVHPSRALEEHSVTFHHITHADIENAPDLSAVLGEVLESLAARVVVAHYCRIERSFLDAAVWERLGEHLLFPIIDTMALEAQHYRTSMASRWRRWRGKPPVSIRLNDSRARYGLPPYHAHHALVDALATAELLQAQIAARYSGETPVGELWC